METLTKKELATLTKKERIGGTCKNFIDKILEKKGLKTLLSSLDLPFDDVGIESARQKLQGKYLEILVEEKKQARDWDKNYKKFLKEEENF